MEIQITEKVQLNKKRHAKKRNIVMYLQLNTHWQCTFLSLAIESLYTGKKNPGRWGGEMYKKIDLSSNAGCILRISIKKSGKSEKFSTGFLFCAHALTPLNTFVPFLGRCVVHIYSTNYTFIT